MIKIYFVFLQSEINYIYMAIVNDVKQIGGVEIYTMKNLRCYKNTDRAFVSVSVSKNNIHIVDSYKIRKRKDMKLYLGYLESCGKYDYCDVFKRSLCDLVNEWVTHNNLYKIGYEPLRTRDCDLDYPQKWYYKVLWFIGGMICL